MVTQRAAFIARVVIILALMGFTAFVAVHEQHVWAAIGFVMAIIASLSPIKHGA